MADWYDEEDPAKIATAIHDQVGQVDASSYEQGRRNSMLCDLELFTGQKLGNLYQIAALDLDRGLLSSEQIAFNLCYSIVSTIRNRICSFKTRAQFMPDGGDHKAVRAAREKTEMSDAWAERESYHDEAAFAMRDCMTGDGGVVKIWPEVIGAHDGGKGGKGRVRVARFPSWEFMVDEADGIYREPSCLYHVQFLPVEQAARRYDVPIETLRTYAVQANTGIVYVTRKEVVRIVDAYHRGPGGKRVVVCGPKAIVEDWEYDDFPIARAVFDERPIGFWGDSAIKKLRAIQVELIEWQKSMRMGHRMASMQVHWLEETEEAPEKVTNDYTVIRRFRNVPGRVDTPPAANAEMYKFFETYKGAAYEILGVSQFIASGTKQPGINSAVAIRESTELQTDRLALLSQRWEQMRVDTARWWNRMAVELVREGRDVSYRAVRRGSYYETKMRAEDVEREQEVRILPTSIFGQTYSGRLEKATELISAGFLEKEDAMKALDMPDLQPITDVALAEQYARETIVDDILADGKYVTPPSEMDPMALYVYVFRRYMLTISDGSNYPQKNVGLLKRLLAVVKKRRDAAMAAQVAAAAPPAPPGGGGPSLDAGQAAQLATASEMASANGAPQ